MKRKRRKFRKLIKKAGWKWGNLYGEKERNHLANHADYEKLKLADPDYNAGDNTLSNDDGENNDSAVCDDEACDDESIDEWEEFNSYKSFKANYNVLNDPECGIVGNEIYKFMARYMVDYKLKKPPLHEKYVKDTRMKPS